MRTTQWQRYLAAGALLLSTLVVQAEVAPDTWNRVKAEGVVRIGLQDKAAPFAYLDAQGKPAGFTWEICRAVVQTLAAELKRPIEIKATPVTLASSIEMLQDGRIDAYSLPVLSLNDLLKKSGSSTLEVFAPVQGAPVYCDGAAFNKKDTALRDAFNVELAKLKESGEFAKIIEPYGFSAAAAMSTSREKLCAQ